MEANIRMYTRDLKILENYKTSLSSHPRLILFENSLYENNMPTHADMFMINMQAFSYIKNVMEDGEELDKLEAETWETILRHFVNDIEGEGKMVKVDVEDEGVLSKELKKRGIFTVIFLKV